MGFIIDRLKAAMQSSAESGDEYTRIGYGDPAGARVYVEGTGWFDRGLSWVRDRTGYPGLLDFIVESVGGEFERLPSAFCTVNTRLLEEDPVILVNEGVASVTKNTTSDYLTVTLSNAYSNNYYGVYAVIEDAISLQKVLAAPSKTPTACSIAFYSYTGALLDINDLIVHIFTKGT